MSLCKNVATSGYLILTELFRLLGQPPGLKVNIFLLQSLITFKEEDSVQRPSKQRAERTAWGTHDLRWHRSRGDVVRCSEAPSSGTAWLIWILWGLHWWTQESRSPPRPVPVGTLRSIEALNRTKGRGMSNSPCFLPHWWTCDFSFHRLRSLPWDLHHQLPWPSDPRIRTAVPLVFRSLQLADGRLQISQPL